VWHLEFSESAIRERDRRGNEALFGPVVENIESGRDHRGRDIEPEPAPEPVAAPEPAEVEEEEPEPVEETVAAPEEEEGEGEDAVQFDSVEGTFTEEDILDLALGGRKTLMAMAKELGISAKGKNAELAAAVAKGAFSE
jgi:hypothetical protein